MDGNAVKTADNWLGVDGSGVGGTENIKVDMVTLKTRNITGEAGDLENYDAYTETAEEAYASVLANVGATLPKRDAIDTRVIGEVKGEVAVLRYEYTTPDGQKTPLLPVTKGIIDTQENLVPDGSPEGTTAWDIYETVTADQAPVDTDHDGIPDSWEIDNGLNPNDITDGRLISDSGYSNLELFLYGLSGVTTSVTEVTKVSPELILYPQPMTDVLKYEAGLPVYRIDIYDTLGRHVKLAKLRKAVGEIDVSNLTAGTYILKATMQGSEVVVTKVVKE